MAERGQSQATLQCPSSDKNRQRHEEDFSLGGTTKDVVQSYCDAPSPAVAGPSQSLSITSTSESYNRLNYLTLTEKAEENAKSTVLQSEFHDPSSSEGEDGKISECLSDPLHDVDTVQQDEDSVVQGLDEFSGICAERELEVDTTRIRFSEDSLHKEKSPAASRSVPQNRTKKFVSYDSLRFEQERLETFIDWPVEWLSPADLARDGFYYLRTADHCACVFCRGIVGSWEKGDNPREEHRRHFPYCPFITGRPVGNISLAHSNIIYRTTPEAFPTLPVGTDVCGSGRSKSGSYPDSKPPEQADLVLASLGLPKHTGPKRKEYLSQKERENSFRYWPETVNQTPKTLSEAGFFYCGLSDHVRCFYCGNGLRNWEKDDDPWQEHARWYPECNYVIVKKGQEFIEKVRLEKPPYLRSQSTSSASITEQEFDILMELDNIKATLAMGFPNDKVRAALRKKLEQTGVPFFRLETCIEAVLQYMEEENRLARQQLSTRIMAAEAATQQMEAPTTIAASTPSLSFSSSSLSSSSTGPSFQPDLLTFSSEDPMEMSPVFPTDDVLIQIDQVIDYVSSQVDRAIILAEASGTSTLSEVYQVTDALNQVDRVVSLTEKSPNAAPIDDVLSQVEQAPNAASDVLSQVDQVTGLTEQAPNTVPTNDDLSQLDQVMGLTEQAPNTDPTSFSSFFTHNPSSGASFDTHATSTPTTPPIEALLAHPDPASSATSAHNDVKMPVEKRSISGKTQNSQELVAELEKIKDFHMCKVCMDAEIDMVFLPCSHMLTCSSCALALTQCPICRNDIKYTIKPIIA